MASPEAAAARGRPPGVRSPSVAELVADDLRERIVAGELADGDVLPKQEELLAEFGVSKPSLREALRILETEGLVRVRRGKVGGAVVQRPRVDTAASVIELVLRSREVSALDVAYALTLLEPVCAGLCASRPDRAEAVLPRLRRVHDQAVAAEGDLRRFTTLARRFHEQVVACCGNETMILVIGALESICSDDSRLWVEAHLGDDGGPGAFPIADDRYRLAGLADHEALLAHIEAGDVDGAERVARRHAVARHVELGQSRRALDGGPQHTYL